MSDRQLLAEIANLRRSPVTIATILGTVLALSGFFGEASLSNRRLLAGLFLLFVGQGWLQAESFRIVDRDDSRPTYRWGNGVLALLFYAAAVCTGYLYFAGGVPAWFSEMS